MAMFYTRARTHCRWSSACDSVQFVMSVATEEGCRMASETFGINYLASDTVQVKYGYT